MKTVLITDDISATDEPTIKMVCDCGWVEKGYAKGNVLRKAFDHVKERHTTGMVKYKGLVSRIPQ